MVGAFVPRLRVRAKLDGVVESGVTPELGGVGVERESVRAGRVDADAVVGVALVGVEVEAPEEAGALENDHFVRLVLATDVRLRTRIDVKLLFFIDGLRLRMTYLSHFLR